MATPINPALLLNPRGKGKQTTPLSPQDSARGAKNNESSFSGQASMLEQKVFHVDQRERPPAKRPKMTHELNGEEKDQNKSETSSKSFSRGGGSGLIASSINQTDGTNDSVGPEQIDLTKEASDDDAEVGDQTPAKDQGTVEVCLGRIESCRVNAHRVPAPKVNGTFQNQKHHWMAMTVSLYRRLGSNLIIGVRDPQGKDFGNIDSHTSGALSSLMDGGKLTGLRLQARLDARQKKPFDYPGQQISDSFAISINVYAQRKYVNGIGRFLSQRQVWLRDPITIDRNTVLCNPHSTKDFTPIRSTPQASGSVAIRTVEQVRRDVSRIFDTLKSTEELPEMDAPISISTPLLPHQKQAVYFLFKREKLPISRSAGGKSIVILDDEDDDEDDNDNDDDDDDDDDDGDDDNVTMKKEKEDKHTAVSACGESCNQPKDIWQKKYLADGQIRWLNVITGHEFRKEPKILLGGILADVMGLGKTLNILSLVAGSLGEARQWSSQSEQDEMPPAKGTLLICPLSTIVNWKEQIKGHVKPDAIKYYVYQGSNRTNSPEHLLDFDLVITTYQTVGNEWRRTSRNRPNKPLFENNWFRIVLDEAHQIRNPLSTQSQAACDLTGQRRWCVTGTPVQNRLEDMATLIRFLRIQPFDEMRNFTKYISAPLRTGNKDAIPKLRILVDLITLRRLKDKLDLPERKEQIMTLTMSESERSLYEQFQRDSHSKVDAMAGQKKRLGGKSYAQVLKAVGRLRMLCAHGADMLSDEDWEFAKGFDLTHAIDLEDEDDTKPDKTSRQAFEMYRLMKDANVSTCAKCNSLVEPSQDIEDLEEGEDETFGFLTPCNQLFCPKCINSWISEMKKIVGPDNRGICTICDTYIRLTKFELKQRALVEDSETQAAMQKSKFTRNLARYNGPHTKTRHLIARLEENRTWSESHPEERPIKSVVFSEWTTHLDLIQMAFTNSKIPFTRLDGTMTFNQRSNALNMFETSREINIILVSLKAGGLGLNLTAASRVYVMEPNYNPAAEQQAIERVHRLGQKRDVLISRFIMKDSIEEKVVDLQEKKKKLAEFSVERDNENLGRRGNSDRTLEDIKSLLR